MNEKEAQALLDEIQYWGQILDDLNSNADDINVLSDLVVELIVPASALLSLVDNKQGLTQVGVIIEQIRPIQEKLMELLNRTQATAELVNGRFVMLKSRMDQDKEN